MSTRWWRSGDALSEAASYKLQDSGRVVCDLVRFLPAKGGGRKKSWTDWFQTAARVCVLYALPVLDKYNTQSHIPGPTSQASDCFSKGNTEPLSQHHRPTGRNLPADIVLLIRG